MACTEKIKNELQQITEEIENIKREWNKRATLIQALRDEQSYRVDKLLKLRNKKAKLKNELKKRLKNATERDTN